MVKRNGAGGGNRGADGNLRNRIEGFGNAPMPPPVPENFEDRLHSALSQDETIGDWYNSARAGMDAMVTAFDDTVNAIADSIEDTVAAVVGDDDVWEPENPQHGKEGKKNAGNPKRNKEKFDKDDGERSGVKWGEVVDAICDEGDLDNFVSMVRNSCANAAEEREVAGQLSDHLIAAEKSSNVLRVLYVMQAIEEGDLPISIEVIREKCQAKLEKLQSSMLGKALATQVLGPGPKPKTEEDKKDDSKSKSGDKKEEAGKPAAAKPAAASVDLLDVQAAAKPAKASAASSSSASANMVDLLDSSPAASPAASLNLLDMAAPASAAGPCDLLSLEPTPMLQAIPAPQPSSSTGVFPANLMQPQVSTGFGSAFPAAAPQQNGLGNAGQWNAFASAAPSGMGAMGGGMGGGMGNANKPMGGASMGGMAGMGGMGGTSMSQPFGSSPAMGSMSSMSGYPQQNSGLLGLGDDFDPNAKPRMASGPAIKITGMTPTGAPHDPFANLGNLGGSPSLGQPMGMMGASKQPQSNVVGQMGGTSGRTCSSQPAAQKDSLQLDDVLSSELAKMNLLTT